MIFARRILPEVTIVLVLVVVVVVVPGPVLKMVVR